MDKAAASAHVSAMASAMASVKATASAAILAATVALLPAPVLAQDYEKEQRWATDIQSTLMVGNAVWLAQKNGHKFLTLYTEPAEATGASGATNAPRGALIIA